MPVHTPDVKGAITAPPEAAQRSQGMTVESLLSSLTFSLVMFVVEATAFLVLRDKVPDL